MTGWPDCAFFVVIFYVISPTIAQTIVGPRCRGEQLSCLMVAHFYMRLQARPRITVQYITVVTGCGKDLICLQVDSALLIKINQIMLTI